MEKNQTAANVVASLFDVATLATIADTFTKIRASGKAESEGWQETVKLYHDGKTADKAKKAELAALFKAQYLAEYPDANDSTPKVTFSRGCQRAEFALKYAVMPARGTGGAARGAGTPATTGNGGGASGAVTADVNGASLTIEVATMAREIADRAAHYQTEFAKFASAHKFTKEATLAIVDLTEECGKLAALIDGLSAKMGNKKT